MLLNPVMSSNVVRQFKYKGCNVTVEALTYGSPDLARTIRAMRGDVIDVTRIQRKYKVTGSTLGGKLNTLRNAMRTTRLRLRVEMGGFIDTADIDHMHGPTFRAQVSRWRKRQVERLRSQRNRYPTLKPSHIRPHSISYRYNGNISHSFDVFGNNRVGYVHSQPNQILRLHEARLSTRMFDAVRPMTSERHVGIEIECGVNVSRERLGFLLRPFAGYVMVKGDGSVNVSNRQAVELNLCAPVTKYKEILRGVTEVLNSPEVAARVNKTCGLHVHLDVREWRNDFNALSDKYARLISVQGILYSMQPRSRQDNTYCQKSKSRSIVRGASRYQGINAQSIWKYTTIETRLHAGTTDYNKIANWCDLLIGVMYSTGAVPKRALTKIESIAKYFPVGQGMVAYIAQRVRQFANSMTEESESEAA